MFQTRSLTTGFLVASLGIAAGLAVLGSPTVASAGDCDGVKKPAVVEVCKKGGKDAVKKAMKAAMDQIPGDKKIDGKKVNCLSCHGDQDKYPKKADADKHFDELMGATFGVAKK